MRAGEPSGPIQLIPPGLLGLLQIKSPAGQNPNVLNADVQPGIDLEAWWKRANRQVWGLNSGVTLPAAAYGNIAQYSPNAIAVPQNQWWFVHSYTTRASVNGGGTAFGLRQGMGWNATGTLRYRALGDVVFDNMTLTAAMGNVLMLSENFWMPPGSFLGHYISLVSVADLNLDCVGMDYTICPI